MEGGVAGKAKATLKRTTITGNHASRDFLHKLNELRWSKTLVDVVLVGEEAVLEIPAHKLLLAACSPYFNSRFSSAWEGTGDCRDDEGRQRVQVGGVAEKDLRTLVDFMYHGELEVDEESAPALMMAADLLLMERVKSTVAQFLQKIICSDNCVYLSKLGDTYACEELKKSSYRFMKRNFEDVCRTDDFLELGLEDVEELVSSQGIYVQSEETVVDAIRLWVGHQDSGRGQHRQRLGSHIQMGNLSDQAVSCLVEEGLVLPTHPYLVGRPQNEEVTHSRARGLNKFIVTVAFDSSNVEYLDLDRVEEGWNVLTQVPNMRYGLSGAGLSSYGDTLLITGGVGRGGILKALNRFLTFNVRTNVWSEGPPMVTPRKCHASAVLDNKLYVLGGSDQQLSVLSAEVLDLSLPESQWSWRPLANLPSWHNGSVAPVIGDTLYLPVAYGMDTDKTFQPSSELWLGWEGEEGHARRSRDRPGVGVLGNKIYMVGGASTRDLLSTVEVWDVATGRWSEAQPLTHPREGPGVVGYGGQLYVIGGRGSNGTVEVYTPETDSWHVLELPVGQPEQEYSAVILDRVV